MSIKSLFNNYFTNLLNLSQNFLSNISKSRLKSKTKNNKHLIIFFKKQ